MAALSHSATSQLGHYRMVAGCISTFLLWPYLSRAAGMDRAVLHALSPADLYLFTLNDLSHLSSRPVPLVPTLKSKYHEQPLFQGPGSARAYG